MRIERSREGFTRRELLLVTLMLSMVGLAATPPAPYPIALGPHLILGKPATVGTCDAARVGSMLQLFGGASAGRTKICICGSDGAASPAYAWCSIAVTQAAAMVCTGGTTTSCP
jgi:hypothetical protein